MHKPSSKDKRKKLQNLEKQQGRDNKTSKDNEKGIIGFFLFYLKKIQYNWYLKNKRKKKKIIFKILCFILKKLKKKKKEFLFPVSLLCFT